MMIRKIARLVKLTTISIALFGAASVMDRASAQTTLQLNFVGQNNDNIDATFIRAFAEKVSQMSNGELTINLNYTSSLVPQAQAIDAIRSGLIDLHYDSPPHAAGVIPEVDAYGLLFNFSDHRDLIKKHYVCGMNPIVKEAYLEQGIRLLGVVPGYGFSMMMTNSKVLSAADLNGKRIRVVGKALADSVTLLGASPVYIPFPELEVALDRGTADGFMTGWANLAFLEGLRRNTKYLVWPPLQGSYATSMIMSEVKYQALSEEHQKIIQDAFDSISQDYALKLVEDAEGKARDTVTSAGVEFTEMSADEQVKWKEKLKPVWDEYLKRAEARSVKNGERAKAILDILNKGC